MDERLQALLVGVGLLTSTFDGECDSIEPNIEHEYKQEDLDINSEDLVEVETSNFDESQSDVIDVDFSCNDSDGILHDYDNDCSVPVDTDRIEEVHCTEYLNTEQCTPPQEYNIDEDKYSDATIEDTYIEAEYVNNSEVPNTELLSDKEKLVDLMLSYNINVEGRKKSSSGLFNFGYNSDNDELLNLDNELTFDDDIVEETVQSSKKEKKGLLSKFRRR